jgi:hypothetical protein
MARVRCITETGMGVQVQGLDASKAARRAVPDANRLSSLGFFGMLGTRAIAADLPYGTVTVTAVKGGLEIPAATPSSAPMRPWWW